MSFWKKPAENIDWLKSVTFFDGFTDEALVRVAELSSETTAAAGTLLMDQGDAGTECFVIVEGSASVYVSGQYIATLSAGSMVGEMALIEHGPRVAAVIANTDMKLLRFDTHQFRLLLEELPKAYERVLAELTPRLKALGER